MIIIDKEKCTGCGACVRDCLNKTLILKDGKAEWIRECFRCMHCVAACPAGAVSVDDPEYDMEEVFPIEEASCFIPAEKILNLIRSRRTIRHFQKRGIEKEKLDLLLDAGRFSPTGSNAQNVSYIVIQKEREAFNSVAMRAFRTYNDPKRFAEVYPPPYARDRMDFEDDEFLFKGADTIILTICPRDDNAAIASANMELAANGMGLGMLYVGIFVRLVNRDPSLRQYLGLSEGDHVATALGFGYPDVRYYRTVPRKPARVRWM
jgi:nitroreductase/NAD-dependent dihydropyrimidine dehydrogenase PreA subunit